MTIYSDQTDRAFLRLLKLSPFERRSGGWRFGTKRIADAVVGRLIASGAAVSDGERVWLTTLGAGVAR